MTNREIEAHIGQLVERYGEWTSDIPLPNDVWTRGNEGIPHTRLKRELQLIWDLAGKPIESCRILDLGCLDGIFSLECALHGAEVIGIDAREANIRKALFAQEVLGLDNIKFVQDDVRNVSLQNYGTFDVVLCSGILYHLNAPDVFVFLESIYEMVERLTVIDTHISLRPNTAVTFRTKEYHGHNWREHSDDENQDIKLRRLWSSFGNDVSFQFTRPSLLNFLSHTGFSSVYECFNPPHLNFGQAGLEHDDRCTFVAVKGQMLRLFTSPTANDLEEDWPEGSLSY